MYPDRAARKGSPSQPRIAQTSGPERARKKFLRYFPEGFRDETYIAWERGYKWAAHEQWQAVLGPRAFKALLAQTGSRKSRRTRCGSQWRRLVRCGGLGEDALIPIGAQDFHLGV